MTVLELDVLEETATSMNCVQVCIGVHLFSCGLNAAAFAKRTILSRRSTPASVKEAAKTE